MPCGKANIPLPKLLTSLPEASNFRTGSRLAPTQVFVPQRSTPQTLLPSGAISTPAVKPQRRSSGIFTQSAIDRYGLGRLLVGWLSFAPKAIQESAITVAIAPPTIHFVRGSAITLYHFEFRLPGGVLHLGPRTRHSWEVLCCARANFRAPLCESGPSA